MSKIAYPRGELYSFYVFQYMRFPWMEGGSVNFFYISCRGLFFEKCRPTAKKPNFPKSVNATYAT